MGIISAFTVIRVLRLVFNPIINSLDNLKLLFKKLEENNFDVNLGDEFKQLEFIYESLSSSFDKKIHSLIYQDVYKRQWYTKFI